MFRTKYWYKLKASLVFHISLHPWKYRVAFNLIEYNNSDRGFSRLRPFRCRLFVSRVKLDFLSGPFLAPASRALFYLGDGALGIDSQVFVKGKTWVRKVFFLPSDNIRYSLSGDLSALSRPSRKGKGPFFPLSGSPRIEKTKGPEEKKKRERKFSRKTNKMLIPQAEMRSLGGIRGTEEQTRRYTAPGSITRHYHGPHGGNPCLQDYPSRG